VPEPTHITAPAIHQEIVTHHRHIDHGYEIISSTTEVGLGHNANVIEMLKEILDLKRDSAASGAASGTKAVPDKLMNDPYGSLNHIEEVPSERRSYRQSSPESDRYNEENLANVVEIQSETEQKGNSSPRVIVNIPMDDCGFSTQRASASKSRPTTRSNSRLYTISNPPIVL